MSCSTLYLFMKVFFSSTVSFSLYIVATFNTFHLFAFWLTMTFQLLLSSSVMSGPLLFPHPSIYPLVVPFSSLLFLYFPTLLPAQHSSPYFLTYFFLFVMLFGSFFSFLTFLHLFSPHVSVLLFSPLILSLSFLVHSLSSSIPFLA